MSTTTGTPTGTTRGRMTRRRLTPVLLVGTLLLGACGQGAGGAGEPVAGAAGGAGSPAPAPERSLSPEEAGLRFARCMRENGVDVPDPEPGTGGRMGIPADGSVDAEAVQEAHEACEEFAPAGTGSGAVDPEVQDRMRDFAKCMRENGVDVPDPGPGGGPVVIGPEAAGVPQAVQEAANEACMPLLELGGGASAPVGASR
ncbi:hypothetical protein NUM3379_26300 [Kineococcus sp. NUM-3379]